MDPNVRSTLLWGALAALLFAAVASTVFCQATEGLFQPNSCETILGTFRRLAGLV